MAYASAADVQAHVPATLLTIGPQSRPSEGEVRSWLDEASLWVDASLRWRYGVPITDASDLILIRTPVAMLVAARCWQTLGGHQGQWPAAAEQLQARAYELLAYNPNRGESRLNLPGTAESGSGPADDDAPEGNFTDPDDDNSVPRSFSMAMQF